jgi:flagellar motor switch protein FliG
MSISGDLATINHMKRELKRIFDSANNYHKPDVSRMQDIAKTFAELALKYAEIESTPAYKEENAEQVIPEPRAASAPEPDKVTAPDQGPT